MPRYILIDNASGYIFGDSADIDGCVVNGTPAEVAAAIDASNHEHGRSYVEVPSRELHDADGYHIFRADIDGSDAVGPIHDGQDQDTIRSVKLDCEYVCTLRIVDENSNAYSSIPLDHLLQYHSGA